MRPTDEQIEAWDNYASSHSVGPTERAAFFAGVAFARVTSPPRDYVKLAIEAGQLRESGGQWICSSRCWSEGGPHGDDCRFIQHYVRVEAERD